MPVIKNNKKIQIWLLKFLSSFSSWITIVAIFDLIMVSSIRSLDMKLIKTGLWYIDYQEKGNRIHSHCNLQKILQLVLSTARPLFGWYLTQDYNFNFLISDFTFTILCTVIIISCHLQIVIMIHKKIYKNISSV